MKVKTLLKTVNYVDCFILTESGSQLDKLYIGNYKYDYESCKYLDSTVSKITTSCDGELYIYIK